MLNLNKSEPKCFKSFKIKNQPHNYIEDCNDYDLRDCLRKALLEEQRGQCFYCEKKILNKFHIDHIKQRNIYHKLECEYSNMALSCNNKYHCAKYKDKHGIWDDNNHIRIISENPELQENPSYFFNYISDGSIELKKSLSEDERSRAKNTIEYLNLNHQDLVETRENIFFQLANYIEYGYEIDEIFTFFNEFESIFKG